MFGVRSSAHTRRLPPPRRRRASSASRACSPRWPEEARRLLRSWGAPSDRHALPARCDASSASTCARDLEFCTRCVAFCAPPRRCPHAPRPCPMYRIYATRPRACTGPFAFVIFCHDGRDRMPKTRQRHGPCPRGLETTRAAVEGQCGVGGRTLMQARPRRARPHSRTAPARHAAARHRPQKTATALLGTREEALAIRLVSTTCFSLPSPCLQEVEAAVAESYGL